MNKNKEFNTLVDELFGQVEIDGIDKFINDTSDLNDENKMIYRHACEVLKKIGEKYESLQKAKENGYSVEEWLDVNISNVSEKMSLSEEQKTMLSNVVTKGLECQNGKEVETDELEIKIDLSENTHQNNNIVIDGGSN